MSIVDERVDATRTRFRGALQNLTFTRFFWRLWMRRAIQHDSPREMEECERALRRYLDLWQR